MRKIDIDMLTARLERKFHKNGCPTKYANWANQFVEVWFKGGDTE